VVSIIKQEVNIVVGYWAYALIKKDLILVENTNKCRATSFQVNKMVATSRKRCYGWGSLDGHRLSLVRDQSVELRSICDRSWV
jgi:hypothetical protein